jgi:Tol biopolymer transport system component
MNATGVTKSIGAASIFIAALVTTKAQEPKRSGESKPATTEHPSAKAVARLVEQIRRHPVQPKEAPDRWALYMIDLATGEESLVADQPGQGLTHCGSPAWSQDGGRILFDATPGTDWSLTRLKSIDLVEGRLQLSDLGLGNCPTLSRVGDRIAFLSNAGAEERGLWLMDADGERSVLGLYGRPKWSPAGRQIMIISFGIPRRVTLMNADPAKNADLQLAEYQFYADPTWADAGTIVAVIGRTEGDTVALIDVNDPPKAKVKEVLWRRSNGPDVTPEFPVYSAFTGRGIFIGRTADVRALYSVQNGKAEPARRLGEERSESWICDPVFSPDGRYLLYIVPGPHRSQIRRVPTGRDEAKAQNPGSM